MNKIYKLKYDRRRQQLVAVSELTTGAGKETTGQVCGLPDISSFRKLLGTLTPLALVTGLVMSLLPGMALANPALPTGGQIVAGQGSISTSGNQMTVNQNTQGMVANWNSFDIGKNHTVQFVQPGSSSVVLNRVTGGHESQILGTLTANGRVMLINPAGVMFGQGSKVNTAGLVASTKNISTEDFMAGRYTFSGGSNPGAEIVNQGSLTTTKGGYIVLAADRVRNEGEIRTPGGRVVLAAADRVTLQLDNSGLTAVSVNGSVVNALVDNRGLISATNGQVYLTARGKDMLLNTVVNNSGTVEAKGLSERGGEIVLDGGDSGVVKQAGMLLADSDSGRGGKITLEGQNIHLAGGSLISATGENGGGEVYVGGGWQGKDSSIRHASKVVMDKTAVTDVSAKARGQGGTAVLWSDDYTNFRGTILARGGLQGGDGGRVETSSHHNLQAFGDVDASAVKGNAGEWLLDPFDISIVSGSTDHDIAEGSGNNGIFTPDASGSQVSSGTIETRLNSGTNVTIKTEKNPSGTGGSTQQGNITVNADIKKSSGTSNVSLTLEADGNINITNHNITSTSGKLDVNLLGAGSNNASITLNNATVSTNGGNITLGQLNAGETNTKKLSLNLSNNATLNASAASGTAGDITLTANNASTVNSTAMTGGNITLNVSSSAAGVALDISNTTTLNATNNLTLSGVTTAAGQKGLQVQNTSLSAGDVISLTGQGTTIQYGGLNVGNTNLSASTTLLNGTATTGVGVWLEKNINVTKGNLTVTGQGAGGTGITGYTGLNLTMTAGNLTLNGNASGTGTGVNLTNAGLNVSAGDLTLTANMTGGSALMVSGGNITAGNISLNGAVASGGGYGVSLTNTNMTATNNISVNGTGFDSSNGSLYVSGGNFSAQNTVMEGTAGRNNVGAKLAGNINVTKGNLAVTGTVKRTNDGPYYGLTATDLNLTVTCGTLSMAGNIAGTAGGNKPQALSLTNTTLTATDISLNGTVENGGTGISLSNATLNASSGNATLTATVANGNALSVSGGNITAGKNISLTGTATTGTGSGVALTNGNMTATQGNISVNGTG
ncbi:filamentous hemagglutinin N-terminal domain-containing protein, partial [Salmonella enterica]|nr:filamentous hemagglutinin N-terminal domain-containing protein [Salmonella enterica]